ncbi:MAG: TlpA family protein disulfide reductase [Vulcanimicrobiaceae bacterium]
MTRYLAIVLTLAAVFAASSVAGADGPGPALTGPQLGSPAPAFSLRTLDGKTVTLDQYRGKTLILNVWATWCPSCRQEIVRTCFHPVLGRGLPGLLPFPSSGGHAAGAPDHPPRS